MGIWRAGVRHLRLGVGSVDNLRGGVSDSKSTPMTITMQQLLKRTGDCKVSSPIVVHDGAKWRHVAMVETVGHLVVLHLADQKLQHPNVEEEGA